MALHSDFQVEYNHDGDWVDALVAAVRDDNNVTLYFRNDVGALAGPVDASRGEDAGEFRAKG